VTQINISVIEAQMNYVKQENTHIDQHSFLQRRSTDV